MDNKPPIAKLLSIPMPDIESLAKGFIPGKSVLDGMLTGGRISSNGIPRSGFSMYQLHRQLTKIRDEGIPIVHIDLEGEAANKTIDRVMELYAGTFTSDKE